MENLIDFDDPQLKLKYPMLWSLHKALGVIRRECIATKIYDSSSETLKPGNLIQIIPEYQGDGCHFRIWNYNNNQPTSIYKCSNDDYIMVNMKLWPYLFALKNDEGRVKFVESVYNKKFDMDLLNLGREIRIQATPGSGIKYYEFIVTYNGVVEDNGTGYYIGLQLQNDLGSWTKDLEYLSHYYRFGGTGIVVTADWIMQNLYKENKNDDWIMLNLNKEQKLEEIPNTFDNSFDEIGVEAIENIFECLSEPSRSNIHHNSPKIPQEINKIEFAIVENIFEDGRRSSISIGNPTKLSETKNINTKPQNYTGEMKSITNVAGIVVKTECNLCAKQIESDCGIVLRECLHSFCKKCISSYVNSKLQYSVIQCPYNKEYKCNFNLCDVEIKDLGGDFVYNKILDNGLKEFMTRTCPNGDCKIIWATPRNEQSCYEQCPECKMHWCFICNSAHDPDDRHDTKYNKTELKTMCDSLNKKILVTGHTNTSLSCAKCRKSNIPKKECFTLQNCGHTFCENCIALLAAECTTCGKKLENSEIHKIISLEAIKKFNGIRNRKNCGDNLKK